MALPFFFLLVYLYFHANMPVFFVYVYLFSFLFFYSAFEYTSIF